MSALTNRKDRRAYVQHKWNASNRGVPFLLTFEDWLTIWRESGKFNQRGRKRGCYVMCRKGDSGSYELGNVFIDTAENNMKATKGRKRTPEQNAARSEWMKGNRHCVGRVMSQATREKISITNIETKRRNVALDDR